MQPHLIRGPLAALEARLATDVCAYRAHAALAPLTILIGSSLLRPYLRRRFAELHGGLINVRLLTIRDLSSYLSVAATQANGTSPLPPMGDRVIAEEVAAEAAGYFARVAGSSGFAEALDRLFQELRHAGLDAESFATAVARLGEMMPQSAGKLTSLATLFAHAQERRAGFHGADDLLRQVDPNRLDATNLFVYGVWNLTTLQQQFLERLMDQATVSVYLPDGNGEINDAHAALRAWLAGQGAEEERIACAPQPGTTLERLQSAIFGSVDDDVAAFDGSVRLSSAPDPPREVREAARTCLRWAVEGIAFHEMAIAYRQSQAYRGLIDEIFGQAGIPVYLHDGRPLIERPIGRSLNSLLALVGSRLTRAAVMEFLTETRLPRTTTEHYGGFEPAAWDQLSRKAGIVEGRDQWLERLKHYSLQLRSTEVRDGEPSERVAGQLEEIARFTQFVEDLFRRLDDWPAHDSWEGFRTRLGALALDYVDDAGPIIDQLEGLDRLQVLASDIGSARFIRAVSGALRQIDAGAFSGEPDGAFGRLGVNVLDVNSLRHLRFRGVVLLGLTERSFPPPPRQDALLLDDERRALSTLITGEIPPRETGPDPEPLQFTLAVAAARERLQLSYARGEAGGSRSHLPSYFFRAAAESLTGRAVTIAGIDSLPPEIFERVPANRFGASTPEEAITASEFDRTLIGAQPEIGKACLIRRSPAFARGCRAWEARWRSDSLTSWDGVLNADGWFAIARAHHSISPTRLETYATCPYRYFLQSVLRLEEVEEPETIERLSALKRGSLIHDILDRFLSLHSAEMSEGEAQREHLRPHLRAIAAELCAAAERRGEGGYPLVWEFDKAAIFEDLDRWLEIELREQQSSALHPRAFEVRFGPSWLGDGREGNGYSVDEPVTVLFDGGTLRFHGRIDRIDWDDAGSSFRVIDYKTGRAGSNGEEQFTQGTTLQLPIYLLAAAHALKEHGVDIAWENGRAEYFFSTSRGGFRRIRFSGATMARRWNDFAQLLGDLTAQIARGDFHPEPGNNGDNCQYCLGRRVCDSRILHLSERKAPSREPRFLRIQGVD